MRRMATIFIVSGPSGSGKTTLISHVLLKKDFRNNLIRIKSFTTRPLRNACEVKDYFFVSSKEFRRKKRGREFLESVKYLGYYYGTPREHLEAALRKGRDALLCVDVRGQKAIKRFFSSQAVSIFILPPPKNFRRVLLDRLKNRASYGERALRARLELGRWELKCIPNYDYILVNDNLKEATKSLASIIIAERQKRIRLPRIKIS